jgi:transcriptional regulator with XRE-family HTH domain
MFKDRLAEAIDRKDWPVKKVADISGVSTNTIYKMLRGHLGGRSRHSTICKLADALGTTPQELLGEEKRRQPSGQQERNYIQFAMKEPELTVLADHALDPENAFLDNFNLKCKVGPLYDVLRNPETRTPMAMAIYGAWGTGKTTAMKWLHGLIDHWNENGRTENKIIVRPVWFYPWKYESKEDVWRGFIWEVIINSIDASQATVQTIKHAAKRFGPFLGRTFLHALTSIKLTTPGRSIDPTIDLADIKEILSEYQAVERLEKAYLTEFESSLRSWVESMLGPNERMVILIDDLDRCMPQITLQVIEAMRLYLNIEKLIFIIGVDKRVIQELVSRRYERLGLTKERSKDYLAKMFQVEVSLTLSEDQMIAFLDHQLKLRQILYLRDHLEDHEYQLFRDLIFKLGGRNPREVKRLINSALVTGAGVVMARADGIKFDQGLQLFFVQKILDEKYTKATLIGSKRGNEFFEQWSQIVRKGLKVDPSFPCNIKVPNDFGKIEVEQSPERKAVFNAQDRQARKTIKRDGLDLSFIPSAYREAYRALLENGEFCSIVFLLADEDLGQLMQISYPVEVNEILAVVGTSRDADIVCETVARHRRKKPDELTNEDYEKCTELDLSGTDLSELEPLSSLTALKWLSLSSTFVTDLEPLRTLTNLQELYLRELHPSRTRPVELEPLRNLTSLERLFINGTVVTDEEVAKLEKALPNLNIRR